MQVDDSGTSQSEKHAHNAFFGSLIKSGSFGIYCVVFVLYLYLLRRRRTQETRVLAVPLAVLFGMCTISEGIDVAVQFLVLFPKDNPTIRYNFNVVGMGLYTLIDLMCECILIYRCWIMWKGRPLLTVVPSILAFASFATGFAVFAGLSSKSARRQALPMSPWWSSLWMASFALSMSVNFILTGLLIARVWLLYKSVSDTPGHVTRVHFGRIITALVESGAVLFFFQTLYLVNFCLGNTPFDVDSSPCAMVYGITPTLLYVIIALRDTVNPIHTNELPTHLYFIDRDRDHDHATHVSSATVTVELGRTSMSSEGAFSSEEKDDIEARHENSDP